MTARKAAAKIKDASTASVDVALRQFSAVNLKARFSRVVLAVGGWMLTTEAIDKTVEFSDWYKAVAIAEWVGLAMILVGANYTNGGTKK